MPQKQKLSAEEKAKVIEDYINNRISLSEAARRGGVAQDTISQWARSYEADGMAASMPRSGRHTRKRTIPLNWPVNCSMQRARPTTDGLPGS